MLNRAGLEQWLTDNETKLKNEVLAWLPDEIPLAERHQIVNALISETLEPIDKAIEYVAAKPTAGRGGGAARARRTRISLPRDSRGGRRGTPRPERDFRESSRPAALQGRVTEICLPDRRLYIPRF